MDTNTKLFASFGAASSLALSGFYFANSHNTIPPLYNLPAKLSTAAFRNVYYRGAVVVAPMAALSAIANGTAAYLLPEKRVHFSIAAMSTIAVLPWTRLVMQETIDRLLDLGKDGGMLETVGEKGVNELLASWKAMNNARAGFALIGGAIALWTVAS